MDYKKLNIDPITFFSHELKTPLSSLKLALSLLKKEIQKEKNQKLLLLMEEELDHIINLICQHLDLNLLPKKDLMDFQWESWNLVFSKILTRFQLLASRKQIHFKIIPSPDLDVYMDSTWITQVLQNLLSNAIQYSPKGAEIVMNYEFKHQGLEFLIQNPNATSPSEDALFKQTGLGLKIARSILENHEGSLTMLKQDGETKVTFFLPQARRSLKVSA
ncbi:MAG: sensor histidine kinase [Bdellovibrionales bacterium]